MFAKINTIIIEKGKLYGNPDYTSATIKNQSVVCKVVCTLI